MTTLLCVLASALSAQPALEFDVAATAPAEPAPELATVMAEPTSVLHEALAPVPLAPAAVAPEDFPEMEYTYAEANYVWTDSDLVDGQVDGWELTGSFELPANFFVQATVNDQSGDADLTGYRVGAGWHFGFTSRFDAYGILSYVRLEGDTGPADFTEEGVGAEVGLRVLLTRALEVNGRLLWTDIDDYENGVGLGARWYFNELLSVGARYDIVADEDIATVGLRFEL